MRIDDWTRIFIGVRRRKAESMRLADLRHFRIMLACILGCLAATVIQGQQRTLTPNMRVHNFHSQILAQDRYLLVWVPPGYDENTSRRYSVYYMHDGQNAFLNWRVDETVQALIAAKEIDPLILVGVYHGGTQEDRFRDYTPTYNSDFKTSGKADAYGRMLVEEIKPFIDSRYRTMADKSHTGMGGASLGGLVSLYLGLKYPDTFGKLALMSPSVWWDDKTILKSVKKLSAKPDLRIWLDIGTAEGNDRVSDARQLRDALTASGMSADSDLKYVEAKGAEHNEKAFAQRAGPALKYLFPAQPGSGL
jgi:predicted alpha/beta superfamily hydrolase